MFLLYKGSELLGHVLDIEFLAVLDPKPPGWHARLPLCVGLKEGSNPHPLLP